MTFMGLRGNRSKSTQTQYHHYVSLSQGATIQEVIKANNVLQIIKRYLINLIPGPLYVFPRNMENMGS